MACRAPTLLLSLLALAACDSAAPRGPAPVAVSPPQGADSSETDVEIAGERFLAAVHTDFQRPANSTIDAAFQAVLRPKDSALPPVPLEAVRLSESGTLLARVPAGCARGLYDLAVVDPAGREGVLENAFRVLTSAENVAGFSLTEVATQRAKVPFGVTLTAEDTEGRIVDGFTGTVTVSDLTGTVSPTTLGPFVAGRFRAELTITQVTAGDTLTVTDAAARSATSNSFDVRAGFAVALAFTKAAQTLPAGACAALAQVEAQDRFGLPADLDGPLEVTLSSVPMGQLAFFSDAACTAPQGPLTFAALAPRAGFYFRGVLAGPVAARAVSAALPAASQTQAIEALAPVKLVFTTAALSVSNAACSSALEVEARDPYENPSGPAASTQVTLAADPPAGFGFYSDEGCLVPVAKVSLDAAHPRSSFRVKGTVAGEVTVTAAADPPSTLAPATQVHTVLP
jgi:hypothetical protein